MLTISDYNELMRRVSTVEEALSIEIGYNKTYIEARFNKPFFYNLARQKLLDSGLLDENPQLELQTIDGWYVPTEMIARLRKDPEVTE